MQLEHQLQGSVTQQTQPLFFRCNSLRCDYIQGEGPATSVSGCLWQDGRALRVCKSCTQTGDLRTAQVWSTAAQVCRVISGGEGSCLLRLPTGEDAIADGVLRAVCSWGGILIWPHAQVKGQGRDTAPARLLQETTQVLSSLENALGLM